MAREENPPPAGLTPTQKLARKLGVAESTIRARRHRGQKIDAPPQVRLTEDQQRQIASASGMIREVAERFGVSPSTVKRLRQKFSTHSGDN